MCGESMMALIYSVLREKGMSTDNINHFLRLELFNTTLEDRMMLRQFLEGGMYEEAAQKLMFCKMERLCAQLMSGRYDRRLHFY